MNAFTKMKDKHQEQLDRFIGYRTQFEEWARGAVKDGKFTDAKILLESAVLLSNNILQLEAMMFNWQDEALAETKPEEAPKKSLS